MTTTAFTRPIADPQAIKLRMEEQIRYFDEKALVCKTQDTFLRFEVPVAAFRPLDWLAAQTDGHKFFWSGRDGSWTVAGIGLADVLTNTKKINYQFILKQIQQNLVPGNLHLRYYGGFAFDSSNPGTDWSKLGTFRFFVPRFELITTPEQTIFACNIARRDFNSQKLPAILTALRAIPFSAVRPAFKLSRLAKRADYPTQRQWQHKVTRHLKNLQSDQYKKIVIARKTVLKFKSPIDALALLNKLRPLAPECFHFFLQVNPDTAFLGASPERLYLREGEMLCTEAIAGTRPRGQDEREDALLRKDLLASKKESHEHQLVVDEIAKVLEEICVNIRISRKNPLLKLKTGQHLMTNFSAQLRPGVNDGMVLFVLHPTPAVAGVPTETALSVIKKEEPFSRGFYAGPFGFIGHDSTEFAVAIRSGLVQKDQISLYAGAGIVPGSEPKAEWEEVEHKIAIFLKALGL